MSVSTHTDNKDSGFRILWAKSGGQSSGFSRGISFVVFWLTEAALVIGSAGPLPRSWPRFVAADHRSKSSAQSECHKIDNVTNDIPREKPEWIVQEFSCNKMRQIAIIWMLVRLRASCVPSFKAVLHGSQVESLWHRNCGRWGSELGAEPAIVSSGVDLLDSVKVELCYPRAHQWQDYCKSFRFWLRFSSQSVSEWGSIKISIDFFGSRWLHKPWTCSRKSDGEVGFWQPQTFCSFILDLTSWS